MENNQALREHQLRLLELLTQFDSLCARLGITYWLDSGTLLGAVREGGFIPWDDDVDVCILASDFPKIKKLLHANAEKPLAYITSKKGQTRLSPRFVDSLQSLQRKDPLTGQPKADKLWIDTLILRNGSLKAKRLIDPIYGRCLRRINGSIKDGTHKLVAAYLIFPFAWATSRIAGFWGRIFHPDTLVHDYGVPFYSIRSKSDIFPLSKVEFEGRSFPAPHDCDAYLRKIYGNYMQRPETHTNHEILF